MNILERSMVIRMKNILLDASTGRLLTMEQSEIDRRIKAARKLMKDKGVGMILIVNPGKGGYRYWFTGVSGPERPSEGGILIGSEGNVISVMGAALLPMGNETEQNFSQAKMGGGSVFEGVQEQEGFYETTIKALLKEEKTVGVVNASWLRSDLSDFLKKILPDVNFSDLTEEAEWLVAQKSTAELEMMQEVAAMMDKIFHGAYLNVKAQVYERDIANAMRYAAYQLGCGGPDYQESAKLSLVSNRDGAPMDKEELIYPGRKVTEGDRINLKMYCLGNNCCYGFLARSFVLGKPCEKTKKLWETAAAAQQYGAELLKPGVKIREAAEKINGYLKQQGCKADEGTFLHGIGYHVDENPKQYDSSEEKPLEEGMLLVIEPTASDGIQDGICCGDVFVVTGEGAVRINHFPQELISL